MIGGNVVEQVMTSYRKAFGQLIPRVSSMLEDEKGNFYMVFEDEALNTQAIRYYTYEELEEQTKQEHEVIELTLYSMYDYYGLKNIVANFNNENSSIHVTIKKGVQKENGRGMYPFAIHTQEIKDAIKSFNNDLLTGNGPDIIMLDFLPIESMIEKDVLLDLSKVVKVGIDSGTLYETVARTYEGDGKIPAIPTKFRTFTMVGQEEWMKQVTDLTSFASEMEKIYENSNKPSLSNVSWQQIVQLFYFTNEPAWEREDGSLDETKIKSFMRETKRLIDIGCADKYLFEVSMHGYGNWADGAAEVGIGVLQGAVGMNVTDIGIEKYGGKVEYLPGQARKVYMPDQILGINKTSKNQEAALVFLEYILSEEAQSFQGERPFTINMKVAENIHKLPDPFAWNGGRMDYPLDSGRELLYTFANEKNVRETNAFAYNVEIAASVDLVMRDIFIEEATPYYKGEASLDEALEKVINKLNLYRSE